MKKLIALSLIVILSALSSGTAEASHSYTPSNFPHGNIIDNAVFRDTSTMNTSQIQSFLDARGGGLADKTFSTNEGNASAAKVIHDASEYWGINPQVTMATLQKEQSLITASNPTQTQYDWAMGYGCPTGGSCNNSYKGFVAQIWYGVFQLRLNYEKALGNDGFSTKTYACKDEGSYYSKGLLPGNTVGFRTSSSATPYRTTTIANAATAALYCYTPHAFNLDPYYSGSKNFLESFEHWFGSTYSASRFVVCGQNVFMIEKNNDDRKRLVTDFAIEAWGVEVGSLSTVDIGCEYGTYGTTLDKVVKSRATQRLYLVDNGKYYHIADQDTASAWGLGDLDNTVYPMADSKTITENLDSGGLMPRVATSTNEAVSTYYLIDDQKRYTVYGSNTGAIESLRLIKGYDAIPLGALSPSLLQTTTLSGTIDYAFKVADELYLLNHNSLVKPDTATVTNWDTVIGSVPTLSADVLSLFDKTQSAEKVYERKGVFHLLDAASTVHTTSSSKVAKNWSENYNVGITQLLTDKLNGSTTEGESWSYLDGNIRLIECNDQKYIVERFIRVKRVISDSAITEWGFGDKYFFQSDVGCDYRIYEAQLDVDGLIRSRNTKKVYYVQGSKAHHIEDQSDADNFSISNFDPDGVYPQFDPPSILDNLTVVR